MTPDISTIQIIAGSSILTSAIFFIILFILKNWLIYRLSESIKHEYSKDLFKHNKAWIIKQKACLNALKLANSILSNCKYEKYNGKINHQYCKSIAEVRQIKDELIVCCDNPKVITELNKIMYEDVSPDTIVDLRNAIREELGFSQTNMDKNRDQAFIATVNCLTKNK